MVPHGADALWRLGMRGLTYQNVSGYSKLALMTSTPEDWRSFLTMLGTGHDFDSRDLRTVPTQDLMAVLYPMLTDPELMFYLEYSGNVADTIYQKAQEFERNLPRQSSSYIISSTASGNWLTIGDLPPEAGSRKGYNDCVKGTKQYISSLVDAALSQWDILAGRLKSYIVKQDGKGDEARVAALPTDSWRTYAGSVDNIAKAANDVETVLNQSDAITSEILKDLVTLTYWENPDKASSGDQASWQSINAYIEEKYNQVLFNDSTVGKLIANLSGRARSSVLSHTYTVEEAYLSKDTVAKNYQEAVKQATDFVLAYFEWLKKQIKEYRLGPGKTRNTVVVRFYPGNAIITEPLPAVQTTSLSENSFVQTVVPAPNLSVVMQSNLAFDTPDTQWRELYANIFKIILSNGNPKCTARIGRHIIPNCYISAVSDFSNSHITTPVFAVSLISTEWDSAKLTPVNYVG